MSALGLGLGLGLSSARGGGSPDMILVYEIPDPSTDIELAIQANSTWFSAGQAAIINWGDGSAVEPVSDTGGSTYIGHTYEDVGTYTIKISGSMTRYGRSNVDIAGQTLLTHVHSFGKLGIKSLMLAFYKCYGLVSVPKTLPDSVTSTYGMFWYCYGNTFKPDVSAWDISKVTDMRLMFRFCSGAAFNPDVSAWNVSNLKSMVSMFEGCYGVAFNPDVSNWNVSKVENMDNMFISCYGAAFNPNMKSWTLKTGVATTAMFTASKTQPTKWLDELLVAWAANSEQGSNITIDFSPNKFTEVGGAPLLAVADALTTLEGKGWTITTKNPYTSST